jgi:hypothetical protein
MLGTTWERGALHAQGDATPEPLLSTGLPQPLTEDVNLGCFHLQ